MWLWQKWCISVIFCEQQCRSVARIAVSCCHTTLNVLQVSHILGNDRESGSSRSSGVSEFVNQWIICIAKHPTSTTGEIVPAELVARCSQGGVPHEITRNVFKLLQTRCLLWEKLWAFETYKDNLWNNAVYFYWGLHRLFRSLKNG